VILWRWRFFQGRKLASREHDDLREKWATSRIKGLEPMEDADPQEKQMNYREIFREYHPISREVTLPE
jgi:hypothetical protein